MQASDKFHDECGVVAIYAHPEAETLAYLGLHALQHRGQESAGIVTSNGLALNSHKSMGLVADIFTEDVLSKIGGSLAIGHTRYSTAGDSSLLNAQPIMVQSNKGVMALAHNGNLVNAHEIRSRLESQGSIFQTNSDTEVIVHLIALSKEHTLPEAMTDALRRVEGAFSLVMISPDRIFAARDPRGFRPLAMGRIKSDSPVKQDTIVFASETCAFDLIGATYEREVKPGELIVVGPEGITSRSYASAGPQSSCIFEHVYFSRPDSMVFGRSVQESREDLGRQLAREAPADADIVVPVPDSGVTAAVGYASESGIPFRFGLIRNHYVGRTFIEPSQSVRDFGVKLKLNPVRSLLEGKRVVLIDDSIVRGTTSRKIVRMVRSAGNYGQTRPFEPGKPVELRNAQLLEKVDFNLPRSAVISGRVVDEYGEPIEEVQVMAMRYQYVQGSRQLATSRSGMTNDIGEFRIYGLPPGQYVISATYRATNFDPFGNSSSADRDRDRSGYAPTYYPGTANAADAQRLPVGLGQKISDVTIALLPTRLARISGTAVDSDGHAFTNATVMMTQPSTGGMLSSGGPVRADGTFVINNVAPGDYTLVILPRSAPGAGPTNESVQANVSVNGDDIDNLRLVAVKPSKLTGRVIPAASQTNVSLSSLRLVATPASPQRIGIGGANGPARVNEDGTFELSASPGKAFIRMNVGGLFANTRIKAVRLNGVDVIDTGIEFRANENIDGVEVELTTELSNVSGGVTDARGDVVRDYTVITFARDREKWGPGSRYMNSARPNQDGKYKINLPHGDYYAVALDYVEQGSQTDPEFLERLKERATEFSINEAESKSLDLKLVTGL